MKPLVIGKGGREHALVKALKSSPEVTAVHALPGSDGMALDALCHEITTQDFEAVLQVITQFSIDCVIIGPEAELAAGLSDFLRSHEVAVFGPSQKAAQLESSKIFSKEFMRQAGVPTADSVTVSSWAEAKATLGQFTPPYVLKADGLAAGKGVFICASEQELQQACEEIFDKKTLGAAGERALLEQYQEGWELSYLIMTNGKSYQSFPLAQDHKRLLEKDQGPNTGGMGVVAPLSIDSALKEQIHKEILEPSVKALQEQDMDYRGILYVGVMVTESGPQVLEYNVRFGDPEAQVVLPLLEGSWADVFLQVSNGKLPKMNWKPLYSACVVLAAENYPANPVKDVEIQGDPTYEMTTSYFLHAGTKKNDQGDWVTSGGRVLNAVALGSSLQEAVENAYKQAQMASWPKMQIRKDIGQKVL